MAARTARKPLAQAGQGAKAGADCDPNIGVGEFAAAF